MKKIIIAVGSGRLVKMNAVSAALTSFGSFLSADTDFQVEGVDVPSGVRHTPLTREDTMAGARQRAEALRNVARDKNAPWEYFVGLEGGLDVVREGGSNGFFSRTGLTPRTAAAEDFLGSPEQFCCPPHSLNRW